MDTSELCSDDFYAGFYYWHNIDGMKQAIEDLRESARPERGEINWLNRQINYCEKRGYQR